MLICNLTEDQEIENWPAEKLLSLCKDQNGIEKNFGFLKDPVIVNSIFLKKPHRIEVLGLILLISLLIWRLMERSMRRYVKASGTDDRLGKQTYQKADILYDDHQVYPYTRRKVR